MRIYILLFIESQINQQKNLSVVNDLIQKQLKEKNIQSALSATSELKERLEEMVNRNIVKNSDRNDSIYRFENEGKESVARNRNIMVTEIVSTTTIREFIGNRRGYGISLKKMTKSSSVCII